MKLDPLVTTTESGLYCSCGDFHIDPWRPVRRAIVTHAHADHAAAGCESYLTSQPGVGVLRARVGADSRVEGLCYGAVLELGGVRVSLHPAGHILGSGQVRIERASRHGGQGETWVVSGDYKDTPNPTCEPFEPVQCDVFITESTFGLPIYRWPDEALVRAEINSWWRSNRDAERTSIIYAYALGKAQRVLHALDSSIGPIGVHGAVLPFVTLYHEAGVKLPEALHANSDTAPDLKGAGLIVAPPSAGGSTWLRKFKARAGISEAFVSGWMRVRGRRRWRSIDRGFVMSDHADWPGLLDSIAATGAQRVGVTHGYAEPLARWLRETRQLDTFVLPTRYRGELDTEAEPDSASSGDSAG